MRPTQRNTTRPTLKGAFAAVCAAGVLLGAPGVALAQDRDEQDEEAERIRRNNPNVWSLEFRRGNLRQVQIKDDTDDTEVYWYLTYTVTNNDELPRSMFINITAESDRTRGTYRYHDIWIPDVLEEIRRQEGLGREDELWTQRQLCMPPDGQRNVPPDVNDTQAEETGSIALPMIDPGQTINCVAIFNAIDPQMDRMVIYIHGLTNTSLFTAEDYQRPSSDPNARVITEAVLTLEYHRPGDEFAHSLDPIEFVRRRWIDVTREIRSDLRSSPTDIITER